MPRGPRLEQLTFLLLKEGVDQAGALRDDRGLSAHIVSPLTTTAPSLFVYAPPPHSPNWQSYLARHVRDGLRDLFSAGASAVMFLEARDRRFALTFGGGRHLVRPDVIEEDFGLRVVLNTVDPERLRSVDAKNIDETTMHTRRNVSRESPLNTFGLDVTQDLVRAVTGTPRDATLAHRLTGSDALAVSTRAQVPDLPHLGARLLDAYAATDYKTNFEFIDYLRPEAKPGRVGALNQLLVDAVNSRDIDNLHLAAPEPLDWMRVLGFRFSSADHNTVDPDPRISRYLETKEEPISLDDLKSDRLVVLGSDDGRPLEDWAVHKSIVFETESDGELFILSAGRWFRVDRDFKDRVAREVASITEFVGLPGADPGTDEASYNVKAARSVGGACLDAKFVYDGGPDKMEICDILTRDGSMIHVKHRGSSSTLSHLFAQGLNSADRLLGDDDFRSRAREVIRSVDPEFADVIPVERPDPRTRQVVFAVITRSRRSTPMTLPFFSILSLRGAMHRLRALGCPIAIATVRER